LFNLKSPKIKKKKEKNIEKVFSDENNLNISSTNYFDLSFKMQLDDGNILNNLDSMFYDENKINEMISNNTQNTSIKTNISEESLNEKIKKRIEFMKSFDNNMTKNNCESLKILDKLKSTNLIKSTNLNLKQNINFIGTLSKKENFLSPQRTKNIISINNDSNNNGYKNDKNRSPKFNLIKNGRKNLENNLNYNKIPTPNNLFGQKRKFIGFSTYNFVKSKSVKYINIYLKIFFFN